MVKKFLLIVCCLLYIVSTAQKRVIIGEREETIYPLTFSGPAGLAPLKELFLTKKIIGLGESTHGTREFYQVKTQLLQFLISECGFRSVVFEASFGSMLFINDYVLSGTGNIDSLLRQTGYWIYYTGEMRAFFNWLRAFNTEKPAAEQVQVFGMDMQDRESPVRYIRSKISPLPEKEKESFDSLIRPMLNPGKNNLADPGELQLLNAWLDTHQALIDRSLAPGTFSLFELCLRNTGYALQADKQDLYFRDSCMAANTRELVSLTGSKTAVWAHNGHIGMYDHAVDYASLRKPMGEYLQQTFKEQYYPVGFLFAEGSFLALQKKKRGKTYYYPYLTAFHLTPQATHLANAFSLLTDDLFFLDITSSSNTLWKKYHKTYTTGSTYALKENNTIYFTPAAVFKGLVFVRKTTPAMQLDDYYYPMK
jgi:erythromycin esterase